jgi:hypothetical protein
VKAQYVRPQLCKYSKSDAAMGYWKACADAGLTPTVPLVSVLVAHGALESGNFQIGCWNNNPGNIKAGELYVGKFTCITLNEILRDPKTGAFSERWFAPEGELTGNPRKGGKLLHPELLLPVPPGHPQTRMRAFDTLDEGLQSKIKFFRQPTWAAVLEPAKNGDASGFVRAIRARRYFTAYATLPLNQETPYERDVVSLTRTYMPFVREVAERAARGARPSAAPQAPFAQDPPRLAITDDDRAWVEAIKFDTNQLLRSEYVPESEEKSNA